MLERLTASNPRCPRLPNIRTHQETKIRDAEIQFVQPQ